MRKALALAELLSFLRGISYAQGEGCVLAAWGWKSDQAHGCRGPPPLSCSVLPFCGERLVACARSVARGLSDVSFEMSHLAGFRELCKG